jgi:hypothetical protein
MVLVEAQAILCHQDVAVFVLANRAAPFSVCTPQRAKVGRIGWREELDRCGVGSHLPWIQAIGGEAVNGRCIAVNTFCGLPTEAAVGERMGGWVQLGFGVRGGA